MPRKPRNVYHFPSVAATASDKFRKLAADLIRDHAQSGAATPDNAMTTQKIIGDGNLQFSSGPIARQSIEGNWNIQISSNDPDLERRLSFLETYLKKSQCVRDTVSAITPS